MPANHPAAVAASRAHPWSDCTTVAQAGAVVLDVRIAALAQLAEATDAARLEIQATRRELDRLAGPEETGSYGAYWTWYRGSVAAIRTAALRLFPGEAWVKDVTRGPGWTP